MKIVDIIFSFCYNDFTIKYMVIELEARMTKVRDYGKGISPKCSDAMLGAGHNRSVTVTLSAQTSVKCNQLPGKSSLC